MNDYQKIAIIVIRGFAVSFLISTAIEIGIIASDILFVKTGLSSHSEISFKPRVVLAVFYFLGSMFLSYQSKMIGKSLVQGLEDASTEEEKTVDESTAQD
ncbi:MAG: hypothetical protein M3033_00865 [Acidobacteriota bacterium]|nr:hypothetical protein [Acidobacteriota bacterium]